MADLVDRLRDEQGSEVVWGPWGLGVAGADQPTVRIGHRADGARSHIGPWIVGAVASATMLSASLAVSHLGRAASAGDGGADAVVSEVGDHTVYTPGEVRGGPGIPAPRRAASEETAASGAGGASVSGPASEAGGRVVSTGRRASKGGSGSRLDEDSRGARLGGAHAGGPDLGHGRAVSDRVGAGGCDTPGHILDLSNWKLTLPAGSGSSPTEVMGRALGSLSGQDWFSVHRGCAVAFRAPVNGVTTSGSRNPRSELREMTDDGTEAAGWSSTSDTHTMVLREAFTTLPSGKPQVVGGQIHDASDDISVFRLEDSNLYITNGNDPHYQLVTSNYVLGTPFEAKYVVSGGVVRAYYNDRLVATIDKDFSSAYFKAGAYTQANCEDASPCSSGNYGEVLVYSLRVTHT